MDSTSTFQVIIKNVHIKAWIIGHQLRFTSVVKEPLLSPYFPRFVVYTLWITLDSR